MVIFPESLRTEKIRGTRLAIIHEAFPVETDFGNFVVPAGFVTDYASVPRFLWSIAPPEGEYDEAAVAHDWLYFTKRFKRDQADKVFLEGMQTCGVNFAKRRAMYRAVRTFGWWPWKFGKDERNGKFLTVK